MSEGRPVIYTRSMNQRLLERSRAMVAPLGYEHHALVGTSAEGYLEEVILRTGRDTVINLDEDAFVFDVEVLKGLIDYMEEHGFDYCGMPDGGAIAHRFNSPLVVNPFFNVFKAKKIAERYTPEAVATLATVQDLDYSQLPQHLRSGQYVGPYVEPFDPLLTWMSQEFKPLYLDVVEHSDGISTIVLDPHGRPFVLHTWFTRFYDVDWPQRRRIDAAIDDACRRAGREPFEDDGATRLAKTRLRANHMRIKARQTVRRVLDAAGGKS